MPRKSAYCNMKCETCGAIVNRYPNARFHRTEANRICGRLRRVPETDVKESPTIKPLLSLAPYKILSKHHGLMRTRKGSFSVSSAAAYQAMVGEDVALMQSLLAHAVPMIETITQLVAEATAGHVLDTTARAALALIDKALTPLPIEWRADE